MENSFKYSLDNKRYHTWNYHLKQKFGEKVFKVSLNAGFSCPNIDGTVGKGGCIYCSEGSSGAFCAGTLKEQYDRGVLRFEKNGMSENSYPIFRHTPIHTPPLMF